MAFSLLGDSPLGELMDTRGWYTIATPLPAGGMLRTVVYVDGDVTTKLIGARTVAPPDAHAHFAEIDRQAGRVRRQLRSFVAVLVAAWTAIAVTLVAIGRDPASLAAAVLILAPLAVDRLQRRRRQPIGRAPQISAVVISAVGIAVAIGTENRDLLAPAIVALVLNAAVLAARAVLRAKVRRILGAR